MTITNSTLVSQLKSLSHLASAVYIHSGTEEEGNILHTAFLTCWHQSFWQLIHVLDLCAHVQMGLSNQFCFSVHLDLQPYPLKVWLVGQGWIFTEKYATVLTIYNV